MFQSLLVFVFTTAAFAAVAAGELRAIAEINAFIDDPTPRKTFFHLEGKVLYTHRGFTSTSVILTDDSDARAEFSIIDDKVRQPAVGDVIAADGIAIVDTNHEHFIRIDRYTVSRHEVPSGPTDIRLGDADAKSLHLAVIRTEGVVIDTFPDELDRRFDIMLLKDADTVIPVSLLHQSSDDHRNLVDARIRVTGVYHRFVGGVRKFAWPNIQLDDPAILEILTPAPADPFSAPRLEPRLYLTAEEIARMSRRSVVGEVLAVWAENQAMLREQDGRIVNLTFANGTERPVCGETIIAAGLPETDLFRINLTSVRWKPAEEPVPAATNEPTNTIESIVFRFHDGQPSIRGETYGRLLSVSGVVRTRPAPDVSTRIILDAESFEIPIDVSAAPETAASIAIGSRIAVTGRCLLLTDIGKRLYGASKIKGIALVVRKPADIVILSRPPWWAPARLAILITVLALALVGVAIWNLIQRHLARLKIAERTRLAVEIHDTLSQNLAGVACQVSAGNLTLDEDPKTAKPFIDAAEKMLQSCRTELRNCLFDLRSDMLEEPTFEQAIYKALNRLTEETAVSVRFTARRSDFSDTVAHSILSVIRELTANAVRHGNATAVRIAGCTDKGLLLFSVTDNGSGFDPQHCAGIPEGHFGLSGIRDRLKRLNGEIAISSAPCKGTRAVVTVPTAKVKNEK